MSETPMNETPGPSLDDLNSFLANIPYAAFLDIRIDRIEQGLVTRLVFNDDLIGNPMLPALHGGAIGAFLETTAIIQLTHEARAPGLPKPIDITINYLRSGRAMDTFALATLTKHGRRVANVHVVAWQDNRDKPIATAHGHFLLNAPDDQR